MNSDCTGGHKVILYTFDTAMSKTDSFGTTEGKTCSFLTTKAPTQSVTQTWSLCSNSAFLQYSLVLTFMYSHAGSSSSKQLTEVSIIPDHASEISCNLNRT